MHKTFLASLCAAMLLGSAASNGAAQPLSDPPNLVLQPAPTDQIPDLVAQLVVQALTPGPAWWKVTKGGSTVWILGTPPNLPDKLDWDKRALQRRLQGARLFLTPVYLTPQPYSTDERGQPQKDDRDYWAKSGATVADLPPATQARLRAAYKKFNDRTISPNWSLIYATRRLNTALFERVPLSVTALPLALSRAGAGAHVRMVSTRADTRAASKAYATGPIGPQIACLEATIAVAESGADPLRKGLEGWANGDLSAATATTGCVGAKGAVYRQEAVNVTLTLRAYLGVPGKTVAAVELVPLLMKDGVIDRLTAAGYEIAGPNSQAVAADYDREMAAP